MFERLKTFFTGLRYIWKYSEPLTSFLRRLTTYPGIEYPDELRAWLRPFLLDVSLLTAMTKNTIDDKIAMAAIHIVDCDQAWESVYKLAVLARKNGVKIPEDAAQSDVADAFYEVADAVPVENPAIVIAAVGLIIQLIQLLRK